MTTTLQTDPLTFAVPAEEMAISVLTVSWMVKQQQFLKEQQARIEKQLKELETLKKENLQLKNELDKLKNRSSQNSSVPPSQDLVKKHSDKNKRKKGKKRGPKYNHIGKTRNGFGVPDRIEQLLPSSCPTCGSQVAPVTGAPKKVQQIAELIEKPVEIREYQGRIQRLGEPDVV